ncbi:hypothetical protein SAMN05421874_12839 [Nonomuraea maritima]|uniref:Terminase small subunit n=1 Tax=Nonomuraea maritima TaxID=683260 RepID=A0A1G9MHC9_9ACTN|nr:hypothetical protein [Nonomuraea maritima]SDL73629.1 hypothetical protein SAMN05421874_12839 [Nonomuraea maritima]
MAEDAQTKLARHERRYQALQMRIAGVSNAVIAQRLGYSSPQLVSKDITAALKRAAKQESMAAEELLNLEINRLDRMMAAVWPKVIKGEVNAVEAALKIVNKRASLLGLDLINRNGAADNDMASLLGNMLIQLQQRHNVPDPDTDVILQAEVIGEIGYDDAGGEA